MYDVYILISVNYRKTYIGSTDNIDRRIKEHNSEKMTFTKRYKPWQLLYGEKFDILSEARKKEKFYKTGAGRKLIKKLFFKV